MAFLAIWELPYHSAVELGSRNTRFYVGDSISGTNFDQPAFFQMIEDVETGLISAVLIKAISRFGLDYLKVGFYTEVLFPVKGISFNAINDRVDSAYGDNEFTPFLNTINE